MCCNGAVSLEFFGGEVLHGGSAAPVADCKQNEVQVPNVVGEALKDARARLAGQPLDSTVVYKPATTGERLGYVVAQIPTQGTLSAGDQVTLVLPKSLHGAIPNVVGLPAAKAQAKLAALKLDV